MRHEPKQLHRKQTLPTEFQLTEEEEEKDPASLHKFYYDTFAFRDRMTNNRFQYREARENHELQLNFLEWTTSEASINRELKDSLNVYKFTKNFEINCIRSKYLRQTHSEKWLKSKQNHPKKLFPCDDQKLLSKETLFQINKQEMKRILQTNDQVNSDILELNKSKKYLPHHLKSKKFKKSTLKWKVIETSSSKDQEEATAYQGEAEKRVTEKIINHMKNEIKANCEYLLNMPTEKKKEALFTTQLKKHKQYRKLTVPKYSHKQLESCKFGSLQTEQNTSHSVEDVFSNGGEAKNLLKFVKNGYINEVYLQLKNSPYLCMLKDEAGNNAFHLAAKEGNIEMAKNLLKVVTPRNSLKLLSDKNNLKRTPKDKAFLLGYRQIADMFELFINENKYIL